MQRSSRGRSVRQEYLELYLRRFESEIVYGSRLIQLLKRDGVEVYRAERHEDSSWDLFVFLPDRVQQMFDIELEILCVATPWDQLEPRFANRIRDTVASNPRVDENFVIVVTYDPNAERMLRKRGDVAVLVLSATELGSSGYDEIGFVNLMGRGLAAVDHFDVTVPVSTPGSFFGRARDLEDVRTRLSRGQHVGVFGLRKAGKTSLLNRLSELMRQEGRPVVRVDLNQAINKDDLFRLLVVQGLAAVVRSGELRMPKLRVLGQLLQALDDVDVPKLWLEDVGNLVEAIGRPVVLVLDEIDTITPELGPRAPVQPFAMVDAMAQLRGLIQAREADGGRGITVLSAGVDPSIFDKPSWDGRNNPLYLFSSLKYLQPFDRDEMATMVRALGKRSGMRFAAHTLIDDLFIEYGGHPLLTRQACSWVHQHLGATTVPHDVTAAEIRAAVEARGPNTPRSHLADVLSSFEDWFPDESALVRFQLSANADERQFVSDAVKADPDALVHAVAYGLLTDQYAPRMAGLRKLA
jgi:hypothetical protein